MYVSTFCLSKQCLAAGLTIGELTGELTGEGPSSTDLSPVSGASWATLVSQGNGSNKCLL